MDTETLQVLVFGGAMVVISAVVAYLNAREQGGDKKAKDSEPKTLH